jgi:cytochrome c peroxidase
MAVLGVAALAGCAANGEDADDVGSTTEGLHADHEGKKLFKNETFGGNGRTCDTCHTSGDRTLSPRQVREAFRKNPNGPLFRSIDSDDGVGNSFERLKEHATIRVHIPLPPNIKLADDPSATEVVLNRGIPTTLNTPALDPTLMSDGRAPTVQAQALSAVNSHFEPGVQPTSAQLDAIAAFEKTEFSSQKLKRAAQGHPLELPEGHTPAQKRGREFFSEGAPKGVCGSCHGTALMNEELPPAPLAGHFEFILAGELPTDAQPNPLRTYVVANPDGSPCDPGLCAFLAGPGGGGECVTAPIEGCALAYRDPGRALITGLPFDMGLIKMPILWNIKNTAPYFHDNSANTLEEVMDHYVQFFQSPFGFVLQSAGFDTDLSAQDQADIIAYMKIL